MMKEQIQDMIRLLGEKEKVFLAFEQETELLFEAAETDGIISRMESRQELLEKACGLDQQIAGLLNGCGKDAEEAICNRSPREGLPTDLAALYDASLRVKAVAHRTFSSNTAVQELLERQKESILKKLEELNRGPSAAASRYSTSMRSAAFQPLIHKEIGKA